MNIKVAAFTVSKKSSYNMIVLTGEKFKAYVAAQ